MQKIDLYRYEEDGGFVTVTPRKRNETDTPNRMRLIAEDGHILTNGNTQTFVIDVALDKVDLWTEIIEEDLSELEQKAHAYDILTGVIE